MTSKNSATLSLPKSRTVRGYEIRKMPIGAFLEASSLLEGGEAAGEETEEA